MILKSDDFLQIYVWVDNDGNEVSPHFDYEEDAIMWHTVWYKKHQHGSPTND